MLQRRQLLALATGACGLPTASRLVWAQTYPSRPVHIIVGFAPGGAADIVARHIAHSLSDRFEQPVVVENRPGAGTNLATEYVVRANPDGYTLLMASVSNAINQTLYPDLKFSFLSDIAPVASISLGALVLVVNPSVPAKTTSELVAYAKANPGKLNYASGGIGTLSHLAGALYVMQAGIDIVHIPYRSGEAPALTGVMGGQAQLMFATVPAAIGLIRAGTLQALAVSTTTRSAALPNIPPIGDVLPGYEASTWVGLGAPRKTAPDIIDKLNEEIGTSLADAKIKARLSDLGATPLTGSPTDFRNLIARDADKWAKVIRAANIKLE